MKTTPEYGLQYPDPFDLLATYPQLGKHNAETLERLISDIQSSKISKPLVNENLNTILVPGPYAQTSANNATPSLNYPFAERGALLVLDPNPLNPNQKIQMYVSSQNNRIALRNIYGAGNWSAWKEIGTLTAKRDLVNENLNTILVPGPYAQTSANNATPSLNYPFAERGALLVLDPNPLNPNQKIQMYVSSQNNRIALRNIYGAGNWSAWKEIGTGPSAPASTGAEHLLRERDMRRRIGKISVGDRAAITMICDHGTLKFRDILLPALRARGLRVTLALNANRLNPSFRHYSSEGDVPWSEVKAWAESGDVEIANHSASHALDLSGDALIREEIVGSRERIEAEIDMPVDTWVQPGLLANGWDGFDNGTSIEKYWSTSAGRMVFDGHAVITGSISQGTAYDGRVYDMDGHIPVGFQGTFLDSGTSGTINNLKNGIDRAVADGGKYVIRFHPVAIDDGTQISTSTLLDFLDYLKARVDAGDIAVLPAREWAVATN